MPFLVKTLYAGCSFLKASKLSKTSLVMAYTTLFGTLDEVTKVALTPKVGTSASLTAPG
jgi:hypothetical protein